MKKVKKGATVKVKGKFGGASLELRSICIEDCELVQ